MNDNKASTSLDCYHLILCEYKKRARRFQLYLSVMYWQDMHLKNSLSHMKKVYKLHTKLVVSKEESKGLLSRNSKLQNEIYNLDQDVFRLTGSVFRLQDLLQGTSDELLTTSHLGCWLLQLRYFPNETVGRKGSAPYKDLFNARELLTFYDPNIKTKITVNTISRMLRKHNFPQAADGLEIQTSVCKSRYYIIRNSNIKNIKGGRLQWETADYLTCQDHIINHQVSDLNPKSSSHSPAHPVLEESFNAFT